MKLFGNACHAMGIVIALGFAMSMVAKPVEDALGALPKCTTKVGNRNCSDVMHETLTSGYIVRVQVQPSCQDLYVGARSDGAGATTEGASGSETSCTTQPFCTTPVQSPLYNYDCTPE